MRSLLAVICVTTCACEQPWQLLETDNATESLHAVFRTDDDHVYAAGELVFHAPSPDGEFAPVSLLGSGAQSVGRLLGFAGTSSTDLYAFSSSALLHSTGAGFTVVPVPTGTGGELLLTAWRPLAVLFVSTDDVLVATGAARGALTDVLLEGNTRNGWTRALFEDNRLHDITWVGALVDGTVIAGDGSDGTRTFFARPPGQQRFSQRSDLAIEGVRKVAATRERLYLLTGGGVRAVAVSDVATELAEVRLDGTFMDLCTFADGRILVAGAPSGLVFPMWTLVEDDRWANLNVGTRETLNALHCAGDARVYAAGDHGMVIREPDSN